MALDAPGDRLRPDVVPSSSATSTRATGSTSTRCGQFAETFLNVDIHGAAGFVRDLDDFHTVIRGSWTIRCRPHLQPDAPTLDRSSFLPRRDDGGWAIVAYVATDIGVIFAS